MGSHDGLATTKGQGAALKVLDDELTTPAGQSRVRVIQASVRQDAVKFHCSCAPGAPGDIVTKASPGSVSSYATIPAGTWTMAATGPSEQTSLPVTLTGNTVHTEVVLDGASGLEILNLTDAAGAGQPPAGGAGTGLGGTAPHGPGSPLPWLAVTGAGALLVLAGRNRRRGLLPPQHRAAAGFRPARPRSRGAWPAGRPVPGPGR